jgi:FixJ family two-component response regulator
MEQPLIAIVDDDKSLRDATECLMRSAGFSAGTFSCGADFLSSPDLSRTACLVTDLNMPGMSGFDLHRRLQSLGRSIPTVLITGQPNESVRTQALSLGIICYLPKPFHDDDLIDTIRSALARGDECKASQRSTSQYLLEYHAGCNCPPAALHDRLGS